ncbi:xanthine dehydrogenase family protein molybdopterin-binding subunit [soil metagenome]
MLTQQSLNRRSFLVSAAAIAGGFALSIKVPAESVSARMPTVGQDFPPLNRPTDFSAWLAILEDDTVIVRCPMPEIGNGVMTQVCMTISEELRCDVTKLSPEFASPTRDYLEDGVYTNANSNPMLSFFCGRSTDAVRTKALLQAGASARERLKTVAAETWSVPVTEITVENSVLTHAKSGKTLRYGEVAAQAAAAELETEPELKPESEWTILGKTTPGKIQNPEIVTGQVVYGIDVILPDMLYAALIQSPVMGGRLKSYDADAIKDMPGVHSIVVVDPDEVRIDPPVPAPYGPTGAAQAGIAVVADHYWQARKALEALPIEWTDGDGAKWVENDMVKESAFTRINNGEIEPILANGDVSVLADGDVVEAEYWTPYCENAMLEPLNGTALVTKDSVDLWLSTQQQAQYWSIAAEEAAVAPENARVHQTFVGGAFGRHNWGDDGRMVVAVAKKVPDRPVHVIWSREETFRQGRYRDAMAAKLRASLGPDGMPVAIQAEAVAGPLAGYFSHPVMQGLIANTSVGWTNIGTHILTGPYRGPGYNSAAFMVESFVDELARTAGIDPLEYRLKLFANYADLGWTGVLKLAAEKAGWGKTLPKGQGMGIAVSNWAADLSTDPPFWGSTICTVAQVEVTREGVLTVNQLAVAIDVGKVLNKAAVAYQI